ncbi:MAG: DUF4417 domain-containing protein [Subdoligranulum sp.]|nr:DUF4417 domain-containing protein [Subdoligranulum sp.]
MATKNCIRSGCKDVFHAFLVENAQYDGYLEIPCIRPETRVPVRLLSFSKALHSTDYEAWVHFYEDDVAFERVWNRPRQYLPILKRFSGIITPDFSLYRDMPLVMQQWNTYRGKALGHWMQENGIAVIPNIRFSDERSYAFCSAGVEAGGTIAIGSHGCIKLKAEREHFCKGIEFIAQKPHPETVIVYGGAPNDVFQPLLEQGTKLLQFESEFSASRKAVTA